MTRTWEEMLSNPIEGEDYKPITLTITKTFTVDQLWEAIWGCDGTGITYWCNKIRKPNEEGVDLWKFEDNKVTPNPQAIRIYDYIEETSYVVEIEDLRRGYELAMKAGQTHCSYYPLDIDDYDDCFGDIVLQYAIFGKLIYG